MRSQRSNRRGATLVLMAFLLPILVLVSAFAINLAYMELTQTELYIATDAAARAGGRELALTGDPDAAKEVARDIAERNFVASAPLELADEDLIFGESTRTSIGQRYVFSPGGANPNSLQVVGRRTQNSENGAVRLLMPNLLGVSHFETTQVARSTQVEVDIVLVVDRSGSMAYGANEPAVYPPAPSSAPPGWQFCDPAPPVSRWRDLVAGVTVFLNELNNSPTSERLALCSYNSDAVIDHDFTDNYGFTVSAMDAYTQHYCSGLTNVAAGIDSALDVLASGNQRPWAAKIIVVMTDGIQTVPGWDPVASAANAAEQGVTIFAVTFSDEADQATMQRVADAGLGRHFHASNASELIQVFTEIGRAIPTLLTH